MSQGSLTYHIVLATRRGCVGRQGFTAWAGPLRGPAHPTASRAAMNMAADVGRHATRAAAGKRRAPTGGRRGGGARRRRRNRRSGSRRSA